MLPPIGDCHKCGKPIQYGEGYYSIDLNLGACAAGRGNYKHVHSDCHGEVVWFNPPPQVKPCACRFKRDDEFSPSTQVEYCGYHASQRDRTAYLEELLWQLYEGIYGHRQAEGIDPFKTAVGGALEIKKAWYQRNG